MDVTRFAVGYLEYSYTKEFLKKIKKILPKKIFKVKITTYEDKGKFILGWDDWSTGAWELQRFTLCSMKITLSKSISKKKEKFFKERGRKTPSASFHLFSDGEIYVFNDFLKVDDINSLDGLDEAFCALFATIEREKNWSLKNLPKIFKAWQDDWEQFNTVEEKKNM